MEPLTAYFFILAVLFWLFLFQLFLFPLFLFQLFLFQLFLFELFLLHFFVPSISVLIVLVLAVCAPRRRGNGEATGFGSQSEILYALPFEATTTVGPRGNKAQTGERGRRRYHL